MYFVLFHFKQKNGTFKKKKARMESFCFNWQGFEAEQEATKE